MLFLVFFVKGKSATVQNRCILLTLLTWGVLFGLRAYDVGNDTDMYYRFYSGQNVLGLGTYEFSSETTEYGFTLIAYLLHQISEEPTFFFIASAIAAFLSVYQFYKDKENGMWGLLCFFIMSASFASYIIAMRQSLSITMIFIGIFFIIKSKNRTYFNNIPQSHKNNKFLFYVGVTLFLFAISVHRTTIILLSLLFMCYYIRWKKRIAYITVILVFILTNIFSSFIGELFDIVMTIIGGVSEENINLLAERYEDDFSSSSMTILKISSWCIPLLFTIKNTEEDDIKSFQFSCLMVGFIMYILFGSATMCIRMSMMFQLIGFGLFIPKAVNSNKILRLLYLSFTLLYFYSAYQTYARWIPNQEDSTLPYYFVWE